MRSTACKLMWGLALAGIVGCRGDDTDDSGEGTDTSDTGRPDRPEWNVERVAEHGAGLQARLAVGGSGTLLLSYWANEPWEDGVCEEVPVTPPPRMRQALYLAERAGTWSHEVVDQPVVAFTPTGIDLSVDGEGQPVIAYTGGDPQDQYCGANDAVLATRGASGWSFETASAESGESATGEPASDAGFVVGLWPSLAFDGDGEPGVLHRDAHFGSLQHDDLYRADAEYAWRTGGGWSHEAVDAGEGAGDYGSLVFDGEGRPVAAYAITVEAQDESRHGVWAARREGERDWARVRLHTGAIHQEIATAVHPTTGDLLVAFYSAADQAVRLRRLADHERFTEPGAWTSELIGRAQYDEGRHVSLDFTPSGGLVLAYHRCKLVTSGSAGCDQNDEALIVVLESGSGWRYEVVHEAEVGSCGDNASLVVDDEGVAWVAFRCTEHDDGSFDIRPFVAWREL